MAIVLMIVLPAAFQIINRDMDAVLKKVPFPEKLAGQGTEDIIALPVFI